MRITTNLYIKPLQFNQQSHKQQTNVQNPIQTQNNKPQIFAYRDFNINFTGRTPEDFNSYNIERDRMPVTMKEFLMEDYEIRKNIPPQQVMEKVYEHLNDKDIKTVDDVKKKYPNEPLFNNLHEPKIKPRTSILAEIEVVKELGDTPLLKDGNDNFGLYLLKKIYLEGKSENEINKDFYEKDLNDEYKGIVNKEITNADFRAYGIKFPVVPFWNSFINTRDEYKKFRIDMSQFEDKKPSSSASKETNGSHSSSKTTNTDKTPDETIHQPRKYKIKHYQKDQLANDIKNSDMTTADIERKVRRRFKKDDPEASFIVKYLSPIMTVAADRIHLSEELKAFNETEKSNGKIGDETHMLKRFWKNNPQLRTDFATAITDTIEMFEDNYGAGGMIPINNEFQPITPTTENQKIIDYVTPNFIDLVDKVKTLELERAKRYQTHDELQAQWEEHFREHASELQEEIPNQAEEVKPEITNINKAMAEAAAKNPGVKFFNFKLENGTTVSIAVNLEEILRDKIAIEYRNMPKSFVKKYTNFILNHPKVDEHYLLSFACTTNNMMSWGNFVINENDEYTNEEIDEMNYKVIQEIKNQLIPEDEVFNTLNEIYKEFESKNSKYMKLVRHAIMEYSTTLKVPDNNYLKSLIDERFRQMQENGEISSSLSDEDKASAYTDTYSRTIEGIHSMKSHDMVYLDTRSLESGLAFLSIGNKTDNQAQKMDEIIKKYQTPLTISEQKAIRNVFMDIMLNMDTQKTESFKNPSLSGFYQATMAALKDKKYASFKKEFVNILNSTTITKDNTILRYIIDKNADGNLRDAIVEIEVSKLMQEHIELFKMLASIDKDIMDQYIKHTDPALYQQLLNYRKRSAMEHLKGLLDR